MKNEEKLKQLKMALTHHKPIIVDLGDDFKYKLTWDKEINNYRGLSFQSHVELGIWDVSFLLDIANNNVNGVSMEVCNE